MNALSTISRRGGAILQSVAVLGDAPADVQGHDDCPGPACSEIKFQIAAGVQHQDRNAIALRHAELPECAGQAADPLPDLGPGQFALALENGDAPRLKLKRAPQPVRNVHVPLPERRLGDLRPRIRRLQQWRNVGLQRSPPLRRPFIFGNVRADLRRMRAFARARDARGSFLPGRV